VDLGSQVGAGGGITPEKGSNSRAVKISAELLSMLNTLLKTNQKVYSYKNQFYARKTFAK
jgi:hypothetical protein